jgi:hypothetical protein
MSSLKSIEIVDTKEFKGLLFDSYLALLGIGVEVFEKKYGEKPTPEDMDGRVEVCLNMACIAMLTVIKDNPVFAWIGEGSPEEAFTKLLDEWKGKLGDVLDEQRMPGSSSVH